MTRGMISEMDKRRLLKPNMDAIADMERLLGHVRAVLDTMVKAKKDFCESLGGHEQGFDGGPGGFCKHCGEEF